MQVQSSTTPSALLRGAEAEAVANHLLDPMLRGAIVLAPEGMGKSALAEEVLHRLEGTRILGATLCPTATAIFGVISPSMASARTMPMGPMISPALRHCTTTAFSPVAP